MRLTELALGVRNGQHTCTMNLSVTICRCVCQQTRLCLSQIVRVLFALRCKAGIESPEIAKGCLQDGGYQPLPSSDVYALGLLMLQTVGGQQPQQQIELQCSTAYLAELQDSFSDPTQVAGQRKHLAWLRDLLVDPSKPDYADQVSDMPNMSFLFSIFSHRCVAEGVKPVCMMCRGSLAGASAGCNSFMCCFRFACLLGCQAHPQA